MRRRPTVARRAPVSTRSLGLGRGDGSAAALAAAAVPALLEAAHEPAARLRALALARGLRDLAVRTDDTGRAGPAGRGEGERHGREHHDEAEHAEPPQG